MRNAKLVLSLFIVVFLCNSCGVTYKKEEISHDLTTLVKKECGVDSKVSIVGKTLYLDIVMNEIVSNDAKIFLKTIKTIKTLNLALVRVILSSDSDIRYMVATSFDGNKVLAFRVVQNIDDVKKYFYMRIAQSDYQSRNLVELIGSPLAKKMIYDKHDITEDEFVGRLITSQINMMSRTNPLYGSLFAEIQLRYLTVENNNLYLLVLGVVDSDIESIMQETLQSNFKKYVSKYKVSFNSMKEVNQHGLVMFDTSLSSKISLFQRLEF